MRFTFEHIIDMEPQAMANAQMGNEPENALVQYYRDGDLLLNKSDMVIFSNYPDLELAEEPQRFTKSKVSRFGIKTLVGLGAYGYYQDEERQSSFVKVPINYMPGTAPPSLLELSQTDKDIIYSIRNPAVIAYEAFRLVFRQGLFAYEFITCDLHGEIEKPFGMEGNFMVQVIGYGNEIQDFSRPTEPVEFAVALRPDSLPDAPVDIDEIIAMIEHRLLPPAGFIGESLVKASNADYDVMWHLIEGGEPVNPEPEYEEIRFDSQYAVNLLVHSLPASASVIYSSVDGGVLAQRMGNQDNMPLSTLSGLDTTFLETELTSAGTGTNFENPNFRVTLSNGVSHTVYYRAHSAISAYHQYIPGGSGNNGHMVFDSTNIGAQVARGEYRVYAFEIIDTTMFLRANEQLLHSITVPSGTTISSFRFAGAEAWWNSGQLEGRMKYIKYRT